jgi:serine/threonine protein kinase
MLILSVYRPSNILVCLDWSWALADLGLAHFKPVVNTDPQFSATGRRPCCEEYAGPEGEMVHRSFDIWSIGCVFAELLVWYTEGPSGVKKFRNSRRSKKGYKVVYDFHENGKVKEAVLSKLDSLASKHHDPALVGSIRIVRLLLNPEQSERPSSHEAELLLCALLGEKVEIPARVKPHVKVSTILQVSPSLIPSYSEKNSAA